MTKRSVLRSVLLLVVGAAVGALLVMELRAQPAPAPAAAPAVDLKTLEADVVRLKALVPSNSHIMMDVQWFWTNLWFAGQEKNWPLAQYFFNESRGHIQWLIKKSPTMKSSGPEKEDVNIEGIFEGIDTSSLAEVKAAIAEKDSAKFAATYKTMLESCYSCHKSVGRPYIKPMIPKTQVQSILNMDPNATWPQ
jgi:cytochrome c553